MPYVDYLPTQAQLCIPRQIVKTLSDLDIEVTRTKFDDSRILIETSYDGVAYFDVKEDEAYDIYGGSLDGTSPSASYNTGDFANVPQLGIRYKYAGTNTLTISTTQEWKDNHPSRIDVNGERVNYANWVAVGIASPAQFFDISDATYSGANTVGLPVEWYYMRITVNYLGAIESPQFGESPTINFLNIDATDVNVKQMDTNGGGVPIKIEEFNLDLTYKNKLSFLIPNDIERYMVFEFVKKDRFGVKLNLPVVSTVLVTDVKDIGKTEDNLSSNRISSFKSVLSDGTYKSQLTDSYETFSGTINFPKTKVNEVTYMADLASRHEAIIHYGLGEELDQKFYLGKLKLSSPIKAMDKYKISIGGQTIPYGISNPMISKDSLPTSSSITSEIVVDSSGNIVTSNGEIVTTKLGS